MTFETDQRWVLPDRVFDGEQLHAGMAVCVVDGKVTELRAADQISRFECDVLTGTITPGYIDLQVNGGGDCLFNHQPTVNGIQRIVDAHDTFGTVGLMPTLITDEPEVLSKGVDAAIEAFGKVSGMVGMHIEGPHISAVRRGAHAERYVRPMSNETIALVAKLRANHIPVMITVAPEVTTPDQIGKLADLGAVVSLGHSDATAEATREALEGGATCFTHLFNAMSPMLNRQPGMVGAAINSSNYAGFICDGIHVADEMVGLAIRARPIADRMFLVSDAMSTIGGADQFTLYGSKVHLEEGRLVNVEGSLAGAHTTMAQSVARLINVIGVDPQEALRMAITVPSNLMGLDQHISFIGRDAGEVLVLKSDWSVSQKLSNVMCAETMSGRSNNG